MTLPVIDRDGRATTAAAEGQAALAVGDTARAREKYEEAASYLKARAAATSVPSDKHLFRFLSATHYYRGGHYQKALQLARKIQAPLLPPEVRGLFPPFLKEVKRRAAPDYPAEVRKELLGLLAPKQPRRLLELLADHPYVFQPGVLAYLRAVLCEGLREYQAAAIFFANALRYGPADAELVMTTGAVPLQLMSSERYDEAWECLRHRIDYLPNPVTYTCASLLFFHRATQAHGQEQRDLSRKQIEFFDRARQSFQGLSESVRNVKDFRDYVALGFDAAVFGALRLGEVDRAKALCDEAIAFGPTFSGPWTVRGIATYPSEQAVADFRRAVELGDSTYFPYYYLAHDAISHDRFDECLSLCKQALAKQPRAAIQAQLYGWMAVCFDSLGADRGQVEAMFRTAIATDPSQPEIQANYRLFLNSLTSPAPVANGWLHGAVSVPAEDYLAVRESGFSKKVNWSKQFGKELSVA